MEKTKQPLSTFRLVAGIITIVLSVLVTFQSCGIVTRKSTGAGGAFTSAGFYIVGGLIGLICAGSYADLVIWGVISVAFGVIFIIAGVLTKKRNS